MPRLSDSMEEGTIAEWLKQTGDPVKPGDAIVEIETDKATMEYEAEDGGVLEIVASAGTTVQLGAVIARLLPEGATPGDVAPEPSGRAAEEALDAHDAASTKAAGDTPRGDSPRLRVTPVAR